MRAALLFCSVVSLVAQTDALAQKSQQAKHLMAEGRFADAIPVYEELCRALPSNPGLRLNLALAYQMAGKPGKAVPEFEQVLRVDPSNRAGLAISGRNLSRVERTCEGGSLPDKGGGGAAFEHRGARNACGRSSDDWAPGEAATHFRKLTTWRRRIPRAGMDWGDVMKLSRKPHSRNLTSRRKARRNGSRLLPIPEWSDGNTEAPFTFIRRLLR